MFVAHVDDLADLNESLSMVKSGDRLEAEALLTAADDPSLTHRSELAGQADRLAQRCDGDDLAIVQIALARLARLANHLAEAVELLQAASSNATEPDLHAEAVLRLVTTLAIAGRTSEALTVGESARESVPPTKLPRLLSQIGIVRAMTKDFKGAIKQYDEAIDIVRASGDTEALGVLLNNRGDTRRNVGDDVLAEIDLRESISIPEVGAHNASSAKFNLGVLLGRQGLLRASLIMLDDAVATRITSFIPGEDELDRAEILFIARALDEASAVLTESIDELEAVHATGVVGALYQLRARVGIAMGEVDAERFFAKAEQSFAAQGRASEAEAALRSARSLDIETQLDPSLNDDAGPATVEVLVERGQRLINAGRTAEAQDVFRRVGIAPLATTANTQVLQLYSMARAAQLDGDLDGARRHLDACFDRLERHAGSLESFELRARAVGGIAPVEGLGVELAEARSAPGDLIHWVDRARRVVLGGPSMTVPSPTLIRELERLRSTISGQADAASHPQHHEIEARIRFLSRTAERAEGAQASAVSLTELAHPGMLIYSQKGDRFVGICVGRSTTIVDLGSIVDVSKFLMKLRFQASIAAVGSTAEDGRDFAALERTAGSLDDLLIKPLIGAEEFEQISIVVTGALHSVPWGLLPSLSDVPCRIVAGRYTGARPSAETNPPTNDAPALDKLVAVCGPGLDERTEIADLQALYRSNRVLQGADATCRTVLDALAETDIVHIAAHGSTRNDDSLLSSLDLFDGPLTAYDIESTDRVPDTVVLACCRVGASASGHAAGYGLASVLAARGARQVIASAVDLSDLHARTIMTDLHRHLRDGTSADGALAKLVYDDRSLDLAAKSLVAICAI